MNLSWPDGLLDQQDAGKGIIGSSKARPQPGQLPLLPLTAWCIFYFLYFMMFWHFWEALLAKERQCTLIPRDRRGACLPYTNQPILSPYLQPPLLTNSHTAGQYSPCSKSPRAQCQTTGGSPYTSELPGLFKLANPKLVTCPDLLPTETPKKAVGLHLLLTPFCLLTDTGASLCGPSWGTVALIFRGMVSGITFFYPCHHPITFIN